MQKLWLFLVFVVAASCHSPRQPDGVLTKPQLTALLVDIYLAEARVDQFAITKDSSIRFYLPAEEKLLKSHGVAEAVLRKTYSYYLDHPKDLELVYDAVIDTLAVREQQVNKTNRSRVPKKQSLK